MELNSDVIVGIDDSAQSGEAAAWALKEMRGSGQRLRLIHVIAPAPLHESGPHGADEAQRNAADHEVVTRLRDRLIELDASHPQGASGTEILTEVIVGDPAEQLCTLDYDTALFVLGHHGAGQINSRRIGTISFGLPGHLLSSVLVHSTRGGSEFDDPAAHPMITDDAGAAGADGADGGRSGSAGVIVGLDTSEYAGIAALDAASFAVDNSVPLRLLVGIDALEDPTARDLAEADLAWLRSEFPRVDAQLEFRSGDPADLLIRASAHADLVVIGKRGIGAFASMTSQLGRTSSAVLSAALSSVLLVTYRSDPRLANRGQVR